MTRGDIQEDNLILCSDDIYLAGVRNSQNLGAHALDIVTQLP